MQSAQRPLGGGKVLASYKEVTLLHEMHTYLVVAEAVDDGHEESLQEKVIPDGIFLELSPGHEW